MCANPSELFMVIYLHILSILDYQVMFTTQSCYIIVINKLYEYISSTLAILIGQDCNNSHINSFLFRIDSHAEINTAENYTLYNE